MMLGTRTNHGVRKEVAQLGGAVMVLFLVASCAASGKAPSSRDPHEMVQRGEYLVTITGCNDCHTPLTLGPNGPVPDMSRMLSGHPSEATMPAPPALDSAWNWAGGATNTVFAGPWGTSYAVNLTPDVDTGIGIWTEEIFVQTLRTGRHWGVSRPILPPMPWQNTSRMTDDDLKAIYAYLRTIPPVRNSVPDPVISEPVE